MSKKQLIVAADVHAVAKAGGKLIHLNDAHAIVTAEARSLAKELGVELKLLAADVDVAAPACDAAPWRALWIQDAVRRVIEAQTHGPASEAVMAEVLRRIALEGAQPSHSWPRGGGSLHRLTLRTDAGPQDHLAVPQPENQRQRGQHESTRLDQPGTDERSTLRLWLYGLVQQPVCVQPHQR
jgi:predicted RecB family endonuclease